MHQEKTSCNSLVYESIVKHQQEEALKIASTLSTSDKSSPNSLQSPLSSLLVPSGSAESAHVRHSPRIVRSNSFDDTKSGPKGDEEKFAASGVKPPSGIFTRHRC
jgi:hypothetical protein